MKTYTKPEISVCRFDTEDIITESGATAEQMVTNTLKGAGADSIKVVDWNDTSVFN